MDWKKLIKSKTFWTGIASIAGGVTLMVDGDHKLGIELIIGGLSVIFLRDAIK